jgi:hypothetical protein
VAIIDIIGTQRIATWSQSIPPLRDSYQRFVERHRFIYPLLAVVFIIVIGVLLLLNPGLMFSRPPSSLYGFAVNELLDFVILGGLLVIIQVAILASYAIERTIKWTGQQLANERRARSLRLAAFSLVIVGFWFDLFAS